MTRLMITLLASIGLISTALGQGAFESWEEKMLAGNYDSAASQALGIATLHESSSVWAYRTAAAYAMAGELNKAMAWLETSAERGYSGVRTFETDADIDVLRPLPAFVDVLARVNANAAERIDVFKAAAKDAEPVMIRPRGHDSEKPTPLLIALHGTGGTGKATARQWRGAAARAGAILIAPDAIRPSGNGYAWVFRDESEWYVEDLIEQAKKDYTIGPVILAGFSQGANIAMAMGRSHPDLLDAVIPVCGHWEDDAAAMPRDATGPNWYLMIGERDPWVATNTSAERALDEAGMDAELRVLPRLGHQVPPTRTLYEALSWCLDRGESDED